MVVGIVPARWASSRFPGKPLHKIEGVSLIERVWRRCQAAESLNRVLVATDDERIFSEVESFGGEAVMTSPDHPSGTDRVAQAVESIPEAEIVINIQGDEPLLNPGLINELAEAMKKDPDLPMVTAANEITDLPTVQDPNVVKVVLNEQLEALYFSRSVIPFHRDGMSSSLPYYRHKGIYGYRRNFLLQFVEWPPAVLEQAEQLEQLRALSHGARIKVILTEDDSIGVDTPEQAELIGQILKDIQSI
jgi:3-deoxy-manno-octulosonate cytidylyltransferase (CMP-KDO synthetase)